MWLVAAQSSSPPVSDTLVYAIAAGILLLMLFLYVTHPKEK